jgi:exodeoxyribonuclease V alpha subunit
MNKTETQTDWFTLGTERGWIGIPEQEMIRFMEQEFGKLTSTEKLCAIFVNLFLSAGHVCLPLEKSPAEWGRVLGLEPEFIKSLSNQKINSDLFKGSTILGTGEEVKPLKVDGGNISFHRYWVYEKKLSEWIQKRASPHGLEYDYDLVNNELNRLSPKSSEEPDWQKVSAALSLLKPFLIISGGPGTGKTTTVARILALHQKLSGGSLKIALAAPTGKAAGRMGEALKTELAKLNLSDVELRHFPDEAKTVHRLLYGTEERGLLPIAEKKLLNYDLVIIDEASMIDLNLMVRLVEHLSGNTRLILLGDKDQLASVEAGSVFADLCQKPANGFSEETAEELYKLGVQYDLSPKAQSALYDSTIFLTKSYRFDAQSGIGHLADAVKLQESDPEQIQKLFSQYEDIHHTAFSYAKEDMQLLGNEVLERVKASQKIKNPEEMLRFWKKGIWLVVLRRGLEGAEHLNRFAEQYIASSKSVKMESGWYHGRMIMITQNDYNLGVFNGDLGVCIEQEDGKRSIYIETGSGIKVVNPNRLTHYSPAWFLTVHKSQGSEFEAVHLLLPSKDTPVLSKELIYTAITRAKDKFSLYGDIDLFRLAIHRPIERFSRLKTNLQR